MYLKNTLLYITMYFNYILCVLIGYILNSYVSNNILNVITNQYEKIKNYRQIMKHANIKINYNMFRMVFMLLWQAAILIISQWFNKNVENIGKNKYQVQFCIGGKIYKIIIKHQKGPSNILQIVDNNDNDITNKIEPYLIFVPQNITPGELCYDNITVMYSDGTDKKYEKNDVLINN